MFEFELSDRPLLPCYNITVSLSHGPRNWLLLSDVLGRLRMTSRSFRRLFPQLNVRSLPEDEFYRQASLSQLLTGPDRLQLSSFRPDVSDPLELVEATPELAGMLGSSLEFVDGRRDSLRALAPPPSPRRLPASVPPPAENEPGRGPKNLGGRGAGADVWRPQRSRDKGSAQRCQETGAAPSNTRKPGGVHPPDPDSNVWEHQGGKTVIRSHDPAVGSGVWEPQRLRSRNPADPDASEPQSRTGNAAPADGAAGANAWKRHSEATKILLSTNPGPSVDGGIWEPQRLRSKNAAIGGGGGGGSCDSRGAKIAKMDAAWQRSLSSVRVHIRDLGLRVGDGGGVRRDVKKAQGKNARVKTR